jgi:hypothetical protein
MKKLLFILMVLLISCNGKKHPEQLIQPIVKAQIKQPEIFHVKVKYFLSCRWNVVFTNDNFLTEIEFMDTFDLEQFGGVIHQTKLFREKTEAVVFARKFTTYQQCVDFNNKVLAKYEKMVEYKNQHPIVKPESITDYATCKDEENTEILIY